MTSSGIRAAWGILGGSFDPIHRGHLAMAEAAREVAGLDKVLFLPAAVSPFKTETVASEEQRVAMIRIAIEESRFEWAEVSEYEVVRPGPSYSWETARHFTNEFPEVEWHWILGTDQWNAIDRWAEPEKLRMMLRFVVLTRDGDEVVDRPDWSELPVSFSHPASSTAIRADREGRADWLTPGVLQYCREEDLYASAVS